ncbi:hypothetical protein HG530_004093 [Fusarium avenaceum]|nr:hypothetical protein HG530_004093 [Fusarium avenaceum]
MLTKASLARIERVCNGSPNTTGTSSSGEAECGIGTPVTSCLVEDGILGDKFDVRSSDTFSNPRRIHLEGSIATEMSGFQKILTLVSLTDVSDIPLIKVGWLVRGRPHTCCEGSIDEISET